MRTGTPSAVVSSTACSGSRPATGGTCASSAARSTAGSSGPRGGAGKVARTFAISGCSVMASDPRRRAGRLLAGEDVLELVLGPAVAGDALQLVGDRLAGGLV